MFAIASQQAQYLTYILEDTTTHSRLEVVPERGGIITSWRINSHELFYLDQERFQNPQLSVRGGIPILFPICGNLPQDTYHYQQKEYVLKQHGFARDLPWEVKASSTESCAGITLVLSSNQTTEKVFPFQFELVLEYQLSGNSLKIQKSLTNHSSEPLPFAFGIHPYFAVKDKEKLVIDIPASEYEDKNTRTKTAFKGVLDWNQEEIDIAFGNLSSDHTKITNTEQGWQLSISYSEIYSTLVFWTVKGKDFICLEPWSAPRNALNTGENLIYVQPRESSNSVIEISYF